MASHGHIAWRNGKSSGVLPLGGVVVVDCNETIKCDIESDEKVISFIFPYSSLNINDRAIIGLFNIRQLYCDELISNIMFSMHDADADLFFKIRAIVNLLMLKSDHETVISPKMKVLKNIT